MVKTYSVVGSYMGYNKRARVGLREKWDGRRK